MNYELRKYPCGKMTYVPHIACDAHYCDKCLLDCGHARLYLIKHTNGEFFCSQCNVLSKRLYLQQLHATEDVVFIKENVYLTSQYTIVEENAVKLDPKFIAKLNDRCEMYKWLNTA